MKLSDFDFNLPAELVAQAPIDKRDNSGLLIVGPNGRLAKTYFYNIIDYLNPGDLIVFNNSKVIKAKLLLPGTKKLEFYFTEKLSDNLGVGFVKPAKKIKVGDEFFFDEHKLKVVRKLEMGKTEIEFSLNSISIFEFLDRYGLMPLPPYIKREQAKEDENRYQTVYNDEKKAGSVASPTAGLHFTNEILEKIKAKSIDTAFLTLHVGAGTFLPVKTENIAEHKMHFEYFEISEEVANKVNLAMAQKRRIIAVGTTSMRALESAADRAGIKAGQFQTDIFITPGYEFKVVDMLVTNFHLPKTTLFMLVCAFAGYDEMREAYTYAINEKMRFFSYGDASLLYKRI